MTRANRGRAWEGQLKVWHHEYAQAGLAFVAQCPPPITVISKPVRGRFQACWAKDGPPDFAGVALGRAVVFDAKDCTRSLWPLSDLKAHQARDLAAADRAGAFAFVALRLEGRGWVLPWSELGPLWIRWGSGKAMRGEGSLGLYDVREIGLPMDDEGWICALREAA